jgi:hypothetical protein
MLMLKQLVIPASLIWLGLIIGISFIEAPLKFQAPGITIPLGLGIGRLVFYAVNKLELILMTIAFFSALSTNRQLKIGFLTIVILAFVLLFQSLYLLPALDERAEQVIKGLMVPASFHHQLYIILEIVKLLLLLFSGVYYTNKLFSNHETRHNFRERH